MNLKLGRKPAVRTLKTVRSAIAVAKHLDALGTPPPASYDFMTAVDQATGGDWGMFGNDQYGCCVWADTAHQLMLRTANTGTIVQPTTEDVLATYAARTGFTPDDPNTDLGDDETGAGYYLVSTGFLGHKADAVGAVDPRNLDHLRWVIHLFGSSRIGFHVPQYAMEQCAQGKPWDVNPLGDQTIVGGHDVPLVHYMGDAFYAATWGKIQVVTIPFLAKWCDEAHVELFADWIRTQGTAPSALDLASLESRLKEVASS